MKLYQEIRAAGIAMHAKALEAIEDTGFAALRMAKAMTLPTAGRTLLFAGEAGMPFEISGGQYEK